MKKSLILISTSLIFLLFFFAFDNSPSAKYIFLPADSLAVAKGLKERLFSISIALVVIISGRMELGRN